MYKAGRIFGVNSRSLQSSGECQRSNLLLALLGIYKLERPNTPQLSCTACGSKAWLFRLLLLAEEKQFREELSKIILSHEIQDVILTYTQSRKETRTEAEENSKEEEEKESDAESENEE
jgi:hypothetical protein